MAIFGVSVFLECDECGRIEEQGFSDTPTNEAVREFFSESGWVFEDEDTLNSLGERLVVTRHLCDICSGKGR